ncbi:hypothetical protein K2X85_20125 [bacterium]|nr:hypothetical protein [bacterium]
MTSTHPVPASTPLPLPETGGEWSNFTPKGESRRRREGRWPLLLLFGTPIFLLTVTATLVGIDPPFYHSRCAEHHPEECRQLSNQFLQTASRLINDLQNAPAWSTEFREDQINGWLADDFEQNHALKVLPTGVTSPRVQISGDHFRLAFRCQRGPIRTVIQIGARAWVPKRNLLAIELETAQAGLLPLPTTYTRTVIEQFILDRGLDITWKRSGSSLVALVDFARAERQIILRKVEVKDGHLAVEGLSGRLAIPNTDYAPTAN